MARSSFDLDAKFRICPSDLENGVTKFNSSFHFVNQEVFICCGDLGDVVVI